MHVHGHLRLVMEPGSVSPALSAYIGVVWIPQCPEFLYIRWTSILCREMEKEEEEEQKKKNKRWRKKNIKKEKDKRPR
ncbi:hypothetical protein E2C01_045002 [Portunus trituberculatus]|uniref:Uncharacterized protein n=1 Tax=Portunus trituberculatus TaxID=210409 RepID=A0A5B7FX32_PORTR|nr:hypothetical protein [Portunus trituberculatus]